MKIFQSFGGDLNYKDLLQIDGAFSSAHNNYGRSPVFNGIDGKRIAKKSRKTSVSLKDHIDNVSDKMHSFYGTEKDFTKKDQLEVWKSYWLEYINAFDKLIISLPNSIVTAFIGRQAIELGFKYLLLKKTGSIVYEHNIGKLASLFFENIQKDKYAYLEYVDSFCELYCEYIEGSNAEYFRYPEYKGNSFFAGNRLDIQWLSYNFALILLKLIHYAKLESKL